MKDYPKQSSNAITEDGRTQYRPDFKFSIGVLQKKHDELYAKEVALNKTAMTVYWLRELEELKKAMKILAGQQ